MQPVLIKLAKGLIMTIEHIANLFMNDEKVHHNSYHDRIFWKAINHKLDIFRT